jgi:tetratricopeptide (TPR) repeat protein
VKGWLGLAILPEAKNLAVLPFDVASGDARSQAFCDGLLATLTARLTKLSERSSLQVVPASEVRRAKISTAQGARQELGVNLALVGSLHQSGEQVRLSYALVDTATLRQLQADTVTASLANPFELEDRIAQSVLEMLELELRPAERSVFAARGTESQGAYDLYLRGLGYLENYDRAENIDQAITAFEQALRLDADYPLAYTGLGQAYWRKYENTKDAEWVGLAQKSCERALSLDAGLAAARVCLGTLLNGTGRHLEALEEWRRAVELEPTSDAAHRGLGFTYQQLGKREEAEQTYKRAIALRPHYWGGHNWLAKFYFVQGRYEEAAAEFQRVVELVPDSYEGYSNVGAAFYALGKFPEAIAMFEKSLSIRPTYFGYSNLATVYFQLRRFEEAGRTYEKALQLDSSDYVLWGNLGDAHHFTPGKQLQASSAYRKAIELAEARLRVNERQIPVLADLATYHALLDEPNLARGYIRRALQLAPSDPDARFKAAVVHNVLGETDLALEWLKRALQVGYSASLIKESAFFDNLRNHPRYQELMRAHTPG